MKFRPMIEVISATACSCFRIFSACCDHLRGARNRGAARQLRDDEECALVVLRQEAGRRDFREPDDADACDRHQDQADDGEAHEPRDDRAIGVADLIDAAHHLADDAAPRPVMRP